ncbi:MAG: chemotaxis protein CheW, partial [Chloroflexota bacterium]|nr:chemotaxis protein CheW [Chloroflexota bacterium]
IRALGGSMDIKSVAGQGTTVTLRLPATLAVIGALIACVADETYVVPITHVTETAELQPAAVGQAHGRDVLLMRERVLPLLRLRHLVGLPASPGAGNKVLVLEIGDRQAALVVDDLAGQQDVIVKQFDAARDSVPLFSGATILRAGAPALIIDVGSLL